MKRLDWKPVHSLEESIQDYIEWLSCVSNIQEIYDQQLKYIQKIKLVQKCNNLVTKHKPARYNIKKQTRATRRSSVFYTR